ncbi:MAG: glutamine--fructose-6-phosphate transaminase (isomerizing) [Alphaproteobacteria bacterium]
MCGIIGIISNKLVAEDLIAGLKRLEYRGYDSAGIALIENGKINLLKSQGKVKNLEEKYQQSPLKGNIGIAHTRWATHGVPNTINAHPHVNGKVAVVHNGIIENFAEIKSELIETGAVFLSDTDTEVILQLITKYLEEGLDELEATKKAFSRFKGSYAVGIIFAGNEDLIIGIKKGAPLLIGYGQGEIYLGSDNYALASFTDKVSYLEEGDIVVLTRNSAKFYDFNYKEVTREVNIVDNKILNAEKGNYSHFMLKEIFEQPITLATSLNSYMNAGLNGKLSKISILANKVNKINIIGCGTSYYAGMVAKYWFEEFTNITVEIDIASEFRYRNKKLNSNELSIFISQSGETADSLAAMHYAKEHGQYCLSIINVKESSMARLADDYLEIFAGLEIGVASTKAFTAQLSTLAVLILSIAKMKNTLSEIDIKTLNDCLKEIPGRVNSILNLDNSIKLVAEDLANAKNVLYTARGISYAVALEAALKLKELSYIHAEGIAAGELKHGTIALIDNDILVIALIPHDRLFEKTLSNLNEIAARGGKIIAITDELGAKELKDICYKVITLPTSNPFINPILYTIPVQLLAYHTAVFKGNDVDQPRNLAKSVTVE